MPRIIISGTPIEFPDSGESPDWSEAVIEFAEAVEDALSSAVGSYDVTPQVFTLDNTHDSTTVDLPNLTFSTSTVRAAEISIAINRSADAVDSVSEFTKLLVVYNVDGTPGSLWETSREYVGDAHITFAVSDVGQVSFTTSTLSGTNHSGLISYSAKALANS
jgi:hypothetical protein